MRTAALALAAIAPLALAPLAPAPLRAQGLPGLPVLGLAAVGDARPAVTLGLLFVRAAVPPPPVPTEGPAPVVVPGWSMRAQLAGGITFAHRRGEHRDDLRTGPAPTAIGYLGMVRPVSLGFFNRLGVAVLGSANPNAVGPVAQLETTARVVRMQAGPVRMLREDAWRAVVMVDVSLPFLVCDLLEKCGR
jgi:hypothetical protein